MFLDPAAWLSGLAACPPLFFLGVVLATFVLEDLTAVAVGALGAAMTIDPVLGLSALLVGTVLGDLLLHLGGRLGRQHPWVARRIDAAPRVSALGQTIWMVAAARVMPGLRIPAYVGSGVAGMPASRFLIVVTVTGLFWTPLLFFAGSALSRSHAALGVGALALLLIAAPHIVRRARFAADCRPGS